MGSVTYLHGSTKKPEASWLCRKKATDYQRAALTAPDLRIRLRYSHLARLWHEMAREVERKTNGLSPPDGGAVIIPMRLQKRSNARSEQIEAERPL
jgi:hypothetical protein